MIFKIIIENLTKYEKNVIMEKNKRKEEKNNGTEKLYH